ncbi:hypothetical protein D3C80_1383190 [compost metagenome]
MMLNHHPFRGARRPAGIDDINQIVRSGLGCHINHRVAGGLRNQLRIVHAQQRRLLWINQFGQRLLRAQLRQNNAGMNIFYRPEHSLCGHIGAKRYIGRTGFQHRQDTHDHALRSFQAKPDQIVRL